MFRKSPHCSADAKSYLAKPEDLVIICGEESTQTESFFFSQVFFTDLNDNKVKLEP